MLVRTAVVASLGALVATTAARAQPKPGLAITPFVGFAVPTSDLLLEPGATAGRDQQRQGVYGLIGGRLSVGLTSRLELQADAGYGASKLKISTLNAPSGTEASVLTMSGRVAYRLKSVLEPLWLSIHGGVSAVRHSFSTEQAPARFEDETTIGGVIGGSIGFRMSARAALLIGLETFVYQAQFVSATGPGAGTTTPAITQGDLRVTVGLRVPVVGF